MMGIVKYIQSNRRRWGRTIRTDAIPHEPAIFIADEIVQINSGFKPVSLSVTDVGEEDVAILKEELS